MSSEALSVVASKAKARSQKTKAAATAVEVSNVVDLSTTLLKLVRC